SNFSALTNYTWSHCLNQGDSSSDLFLYYQDQFNRKAEWGNCAVDRRNVANLSLVTHTRGIGSSWARRLTNDWSLSGIFSSVSGPWLTAVTGTDVSLTGNAKDRPTIAGDWRVANPTITKWFNTDAF